MTMSCWSRSDRGISIVSVATPLLVAAVQAVVVVAGTDTARGLVEAREGVTSRRLGRILPFEEYSRGSPTGSPLSPTTMLVVERRRAGPPTRPAVASPPPLPSSDGPVGGCLQGSWLEWQKIRQDRWVTDVIRSGYELTFVGQPPLSQPIALPSYEPGSERAIALDDAVRQMIAKGAAELVEPAEYLSSGFYSRLFVVPKPGEGNWRPIIDLSDLNKFMEVPECKFETPKSVLQSVGRADWMASVDLKDVYFQIPIRPRSRSTSGLSGTAGCISSKLCASDCLRLPRCSPRFSG